MADNNTEKKPTREQAVSDLLRLGELLAQHSGPIGDLGLSRPLRPDESIAIKAEVADLERRIEARAYDRTDRTLRAMLDIRRDEILDPILLRCIACVAYYVLDGGRSLPTVAAISKAAGLGDWGTTLSARHEIRQAIIKGKAFYFSDSEYGDGILKVGRDLMKFLSGENRLKIVWTEETLKKEKEEWERRNAKVIRQCPPPDESPAPSAQASPKITPTSGMLDSPKAIFEALRRTVIGMDQVVKKFSVQMAMHLKRVAIIASGAKASTPPVCCLLIGPSGAGKSFLASEFGRISNYPFAIGDMSSVTASAYVGSSIDELFYGFTKKGTKLSDVQRGILFLDEIDKKRTNNRGGDFDAMGSGVQYEILRMLEGTRIQVGGKRGNDSVSRGFVETASMGFILGGAFSSISDALAEKAKVPIGFSGGRNGFDTAPDVRELLLEYFIPELVNRIGSVIVIPPPSLGALVQIATAETGIIQRQNQFLASFDLKIIPSEHAIREIANWAMETKTFARGMRSLTQSLVEQAIFDEHKGELVIGVKHVRKAIEGLRQEPEELQK